MMRGSRVGRPLLGKWHLRSFVVSVIGLPAPWADSSPREAPRPASSAPSQGRAAALRCSATWTRLVHNRPKLPRDLFYPLHTHTHLRRCAPSTPLPSSLVVWDDAGAPSSAVPSRVLSSAAAAVIPARGVRCLFYPVFFLLISLPSCASYPPSKHLSRPALPTLCLPPLQKDSGLLLGLP